MSLKGNIISGYVSQIYVALIGVLILPLYIRYMGAEAYGLIGFFTMLQAWFSLLDMGLTPTIGRETARYRAGASGGVEFRRLFRVLSCIFYGLAFIGGGVLFFLSEKISASWLKPVALSANDIQTALQIMAITIALRWIGGLYRGVVSGSEQIIWLSAFNVIIATLRFVVVLPVMLLYGATPFVFFWFQLLVSVIEVVGLFYKSRLLLPILGAERIGWSIEPIKPVLKFSLSIAFTSAVWILVTQSDKLILSNVLALSEYGHFTLAVLMASGIMVISGPISLAIMPRMAKLHMENMRSDLIKVYRDATQIVSVISGAAAITMFFCSETVVYLWTGDAKLAQEVSPILSLYSLGNGILSIGAFPYYLQYAKGNLKYHLFGNLGLLLFLIPLIILAAREYGAIGAGIVWVAMNAIYLFVWVAYVHYKLEPGIHLKWIMRDVLTIIFPAILIGALFEYVMLKVFHYNGNSFVYLTFFGLVVLATAILGSSYSRSIFSSKVLARG
ncbi:oligosaccharide flippase family protein [Pseudomonas lurida]|nr:oligosaccharide flippase family protein [Pseudomonas lurida]